PPPPTTPRRAAELGAPFKEEAAPSGTRVRPEDVTLGQTVRADPSVSIPSQTPRTAPEVSPVPDVPARVPSCSLVGGQLRNFALYDLHGQPWEYKKSRRGRLLLLDFWATDCPPCVA